MYELLPGERVIAESMNKRVLLTSQRVCYSCKAWGRSYHQQITLEQISSCEHHYGSRIWLLVMAGLFLAAGLAAGANENISVLCGAFLIALLCSILYLITRSSMIAIASSGTKMRINVIGLSEAEVLRFIYLLGKAQQQHIRSLHNDTLSS